MSNSPRPQDEQRRQGTEAELEERLRRGREERVRKSLAGLERDPESLMGLFMGDGDAPKWLRVVGVICAIGIALVFAWLRWV